MIDSASEPDGADDLRKARRRKATHDFGIIREMPNGIEAEQGILSCCLISPRNCIPEAVKKMKDDGKGTAIGSIFYDLRHQTIWEHLVGMSNENKEIDVITLQQRLKDAQLLDQVGGIPYLSQLMGVAPSAANLDYYIEIAFEKFILRTLIQACTNAVGRIHDYEGEVDALLDEIERDILAVSQIRKTTDIPTIKDLVHGAIQRIEQFFKSNGQPSGLTTGFPDLDKLTDGLQKSEMIVIAARPSLGKTSLAMNIVEHVCIEGGRPTGVFSLEMSAESLTLRTQCSLARVNLRNIKDGFMSETDFPKLTSASGRIAKAPLFIDATPGLSILQLRARARRMMQEHDIELFVVDYLQLLHSTAKRAKDNRQQEISDISGGLKSMAKELKVPVLVLSQLNRELDKSKGRKPRLSDLRESGAIEQDADVVGLLYKPGQHSDDDEDAIQEADGLAVDLLIAKQRNGPTGTVHLTFLKSFTRFESAAKVSDEDVPGN